MARNEDGEFELILGNKQLLSVFFLMVLLLALCFVGGYALGRSAAPVLSASSPAPEAPKQVAEVQPAKQDPAPQPAPEPEPAKPPLPPPPTRTAPQVATETVPLKTGPQAETAKAEPVKPKVEPAKAAPNQTAAAKQPPANSQPVPGRIYLQLSATDKDKADVMVDLLRQKNLPGIAAAITERPGLYRVLVGPLAENGLNDMKARLKANGFPADEAIRRVF